MKKHVVCFLLLFSLLTSACFAEVYKNSKLGVQFIVPKGFKKEGKDFTLKDKNQIAVIAEWVPLKTGKMPGKIKFGGTTLIKFNQVTAKDMYQLDLNTTQKNSKNYSLVAPIKIKGAVGAFLVKEKSNNPRYKWKITAYGNDYMYEWTFYGDPKSFNRFEPVIRRLQKSIKIKK